MTGVEEHTYKNQEHLPAKIPVLDPQIWSLLTGKGCKYFSQDAALKQESFNGLYKFGVSYPTFL